MVSFKHPKPTPDHPSLEEAQKLLLDVLDASEKEVGAKKLPVKVAAYLHAMAVELYCRVKRSETVIGPDEYALVIRIAWRLGYYEAIQAMRKGELVVKPDEGETPQEGGQS